MLPAWLGFAILAMLLWGLWAFLPRIATRTLDLPTTLFFQQLGAMSMGVVVLAVSRFKLKLEPTGIQWAYLTGLLGVCGLLCYFQAVSRQRVSVVIMVTALYPIVTLLLSMVFLREKLALLHWIGVGLAMVAILLMSTPTR